MSRLQIIRGIPFPNLSTFKRENIEKTMDYLPKDGDIIIASYPKTGTTWLQYIVLQIISKGKSFPSLTDTLEKVVPFMAMAGPEAIDNLTGVRTYKHHYRYDMVKKNPKAKVLYIYRNPADTVVSLYYFIQEIWREKFDFDEFFDGFLIGQVESGRYFEHALSYLAHKNDDNLLLISYEKLHSNRKEGILRIARFLGEEYYQNLSENESLMNEILEHTSFDYMKKYLIPNLSDINKISPKPKTDHSSEKPKDTVDFFRKGIVGDGKNLLSPGQLKRLQEVAKEVMKDNEVLKEWFKE